MKLRNEVLKTIGEKFRRNSLLNIGSIFVFVLLFGASLSVKAQNYVVDRIEDNINFSACDTFTANDCSLRGAIQRANTDGVDSIIQLAIPQNFGQTFVLQFSLSINNDGTLLITSDPIISATIGNRRGIDGGTTVRVFAVNPGANVTFRNIGISNGGFSAPNDGAAIDNNGGTVTIDNCFFGANAATDDGGAVKNTSNGTMTINNSDFLNNFATSNRGGAIWNEGTMTITTSLFRSNKGKYGGAIANSGTLTIRNTTISGNESTDSGGGIYTLGGTVSIGNSTITRNRADFPSDGIGAGGGVGKSSPEFTVNVGSSIIAGNSNGTVPNSADFDGVMTSQLGYNLLGNSLGTTVTGQTFGNQLDVDPKLLPLRNNGGSLMTHALAPNSPAIDKGSQISLPNLLTDNRGQPRQFDFPGIPDLNTGVDIGAFERQPSDRNLFDFDGDRKTDLSIFRPSAGEWWYQRSLDGQGYAGQFGASTDRIVPADLTGDGKTDIAIWRPSSGEWFVLRSEDGSFYSFPFGTSGDIPRPADFDGDGIDDPAIFRPSTATWFILQSGGGTRIEQFGTNGDIPMPADYDGDGKADIAIFRPSAGEWWLNRSTVGGYVTRFGVGTDKPVPGDYTGDSKTDIAIWRPSTGEWFVLRSEDFSFYSFPFGTSGDIPAPGDYDGDGITDPAIFRPSTATWFILQTSAGTAIQQFGTNGDLPTPSAFVP